MVALATAFVRLAPDTTTFKAEAQAKVDKMSVRIRVTPDLTGFVTAIRAALRAELAAHRLEVKIKAVLDDAKFLFGLTKLLRDRTIRIRPVISTAQFHLARELRKAGVSTAVILKVRPNLDLTAFRAQYRLFELVYLRDRSFQVSPTLNLSGYLSALTGLINTSGNSGSAAGSAFGGGFNSRWKLIIGAIVGSLPLLQPLLSVLSSLIQAAGALGAALPLAIAGLAVTVGTLVLAFHGLKKAISGAFSSSPTKDETEAYDKLSKSAKGFVQTLVDTRKQLSGFQVHIQEQFFAPFLGGFRALIASPALSIMRTEMGLIAGIAGTAAAGIARVFATAAQGGLLKEILVAIRDIFGRLIGTLPALTQLFLTLAKAAIPFGTVLTDHLVGGLAKFTDMINRLAANGGLAKFFEGGMTALESLGSLLGSLGSIVSSVFTAFSSNGNTVVGVLGVMVQRLADFLKTAQGQEALRTLAQILGLVGDVLSAVLVPLLPVVAKLVAVFGGPLVDAITKLLGPLNNFAELLARELLVVIVALAPVISKFIGLLADFLVQAITALAANMRQMLPTLIELANRLGPQLIPFVEALFKALFALLPLLPDMTKAILALVPVLISLLPLFVGMIKATTLLWQGIAFLIGFFAPLTGWFIKLLAIGVAKFFEEIVGMVKGAVPAFHDIAHVVGVVAGALVTAFQWIGSVWQIVVTGIATALIWIAERFTQWRLNVGAVITTVSGWLTGFLGFIRDGIAVGIAAVTGAISVAFNTMKTLIGIAIGAVRDGIAAGWAAIRDRSLQPLINFVTQTIPNAFQTGVDAVKRLWDKLQAIVATPVRWVIDNVIRKVVSVFNTVSGAVGGPHIPDVSAGFGDGGPVSSGGNGRILARAQGGLIGPGVQAFAMGGSAKLTRPGIITGPGGSRQDRVPLMGSPDEFIVNAKSTRKWRPLLEEINNQGKLTRLGVANDGPGFESGGLIGAIGSVVAGLANPSKFFSDQISGLLGRIPGAGVVRDMTVAAVKKLMAAAIAKITSLASVIGPGGPTGAGPGFSAWPSSPSASRGDSGVWRSIVNLIRKTGPLSGSFGNAYRPGDPLWHGSGRAVDWMGFNQDALATFFMNMRGRVLELIHRTPRRDYAVTRGRDRGSFNNSLMEAHRNHIHIAMREGGLIGKLVKRLGIKSFDSGGPWRSGTFGYNGSGRTETVTTGDDADSIIGLLLRLIRAVENVAPGVGAEMRGQTRAMNLAARAL